MLTLTITLTLTLALILTLALTLKVTLNWYNAFPMPASKLHSSRAWFIRWPVRPVRGLYGPEEMYRLSVTVYTSYTSLGYTVSDFRTL